MAKGFKESLKREFSAGGIALKGNKVLLICVQAGDGLYWEFPKGHIESGQTTKEAAIREVLEEGGVVAEIIDRIDVSKYIYTRRTGERIFKIVTFFLMNYVSGDTKDHDQEVMDAVWFPPEEALEKLSFRNDKKLLGKAISMLEK